MTELWTADELMQATGGTMARPFAASGVSIDTRTLAPGDLFVALVGDNRDGHDFAPAALSRGAAGALVQREIADIRTLVVDDTLAALHRLGGFARARFTGKLVAVTGSVGKTTTKEMLRAILSAQAKTWAAEASHNNHWGVPLTLARLPPSAKYCVAEIGMNHAGEIAPLTRLARPHVAVVTTVAGAHIGHLGSLEAIADEKASIAMGLEPGGVLLLPADSPYFERMAASTHADVQGFGTSAKATHRLKSAVPDADGTDLVVMIGPQEIRFRMAAPGLHMAMNAVAALGAAAALGADPLEAAATLATFVPGAGRGARREIALAEGRVVLLDESYNASAIAVKAALALLGLVPAQRRIAVLGDMLELGDAGPGEHVGLADDVATHADLLFTCGPLMRGLQDAIPPARRGAHAADSALLAPIVLDALRAGDVVLVKGSLGSRMKKIVDALDAAAAAAADQPKDPR